MTAQRLALAIALTVCASTMAAAGPAEEYADKLKLQMQADVGKAYWAPGFTMLCHTPHLDNATCERAQDVEFRVKSAVPGDSLLTPFFEVETRDGRQGFILGSFRSFFRDAKLTTSQRAQVAECMRTGPTIGMTGAEAINCWGQPHNVTTTLTAKGKVEVMVFSEGLIYLTDGKISVVQTSR